MPEISVTVNVVVGDAELELRRSAKIVNAGDVNGAVRAFMRQAHRAVAGAYQDYNGDADEEDLRDLPV